MRTRTTFYMAVTPDKYELPIYVADTIEELASRYNVSKNLIYSCVSKNKSGERSGRKFVKVKIK